MSDEEVDNLDYHELQEHTKRVLEAARAELARLDRERAALIDRIHHMEVMLGIRKYPAPKKKRGRIKSETLKTDITDILNRARGKKLSAAEILEELTEKRSYPRTRSLRTRVYSSLSKWAKEGEFLERVERGVYRLL